MDNFAYLMQSITDTTNSSSVLKSTSPFLNHTGLRDWVSTHYLRKNGPDRTPASDTAAGLIPALLELTDTDKVERLIAAERRTNPKFDAWLTAGFAPEHTVELFANCPKGSFGALYHTYLVEQNLQPNLARGKFEPRSAYEFIRYRFGQIHDFEHIISGGAFNTLGELLPYFSRLSNVHKHISPELAGALTQIYILGGYRFPVRAGLHYPQVYLTVLDLLQRGIRIGLNSEPFFMGRFEDFLHLTVPEAREALGVRYAEDVDTRAQSAIFDDMGG